MALYLEPWGLWPLRGWNRKHKPSQRSESKEKIKKEKLDKLLQIWIINQDEYNILSDQDPWIIDQYYEILSFWWREDKKVIPSNEERDKVELLPLEQKLFAVEWLKFENEKVQKLQSHLDERFINQNEYDLLIWKWPQYVSEVLQLIWFLRRLHNDRLITDYQFEEINSLTLEAKIENIKILEKRFELEQAFLTNCHWLSHEKIEEWLNLWIEDLDMYSTALAIINFLRKNSYTYLSEDLYIYMKNLDPSIIWEKVDLLKDIINKIEKEIEALKSSEEQMFFFENTEKIQKVIELWVKDPKKYFQETDEDKKGILEKLKKEINNLNHL